MPNTNRTESLRISTGQVSEIVSQISKALPSGIKLEQGEQYGGYTRLIFSSVLLGERIKDKLVIDIRTGPQASGNTPSILIRGRGPVESASETYVGSKIIPASGESAAYYKETPIKSFTDIVAGTFEAKRKELGGGIRGERTLEQHMRALTSASSGKEYDEIREAWKIPKSMQQSWGRSTPGEQAQLAATTPIVLRQNMRLKGEQPVPVHFNVELARIEAQIESGETGFGVGSLSREGQWGAARTSENAYILRKTGTVEVTRTSSGNVGVRAIVARGATEGTTESLMKQQKMQTTLWRSRSPEVVPLRINQATGRMEPIEAESLEESIGIKRARGGMLVPRAPIYARGGIAYAGEGGKERNVRPMFTMFSATPTHEGGMVISPRVAQNIAGFGLATGGQIVELPKLKSTDLDPEIVGNDIDKMFDIQDLSKVQVAAGARRGRNLGTLNLAGTSLDIKLQKKEYLQQLGGATLVIPPYQDEAGNFYDDPRKAPKGTLVFKTDKLAENLNLRLASKGITVENTGTESPYLSIGVMGVISASAKGMAAVKTSETMIGGPTGPYVTISAGDQVRQKIMLDAVTKEAKIMPYTMASNFGLQPYENKIDLLNMLDTRLAEWYKKTYKPGDVVDERALANKYGELGGEHTDPIFMWGQMLETVLSKAENKKTNIEYIEKYGIGLAHGGVAYGGRVTQTWVNEQTAIIRDSTDPDVKGKTLEQLGMHVVPVKDDPNMYELLYTTSALTPSGRPTRSILMMTGMGTSSEFPGQGEEINAEIAASISANLPQFAKELGLLPEQGLGEGKLTKRLAWQGMAKAYSLNLATMQGEGRQVEGTYVIGKEEAEDLLTNPIFSSELGGETEKKAMEILSKLTKGKMPYFKTTGRYLPEARHVIGIDLFDKAKNQGESVSHFTTQYIKAFTELLKAERDEVVDPSYLRTHTSFIGGPESRIGEALSGKEVRRHIFGKEVEGTVSGHYKVMNALNPGEVYIGDQEIERLGRSMGIERASDLKLLKRYINESKGTSAMFWRYPTLSEEHGAAPVSIIGKREIEKRIGARVGDYSAFDPGTIYVNPFTPEWFIGDEDSDPGGLMIGIKPEWEEKKKDGKTYRRLKGFTDRMAADPEYAKNVSEYKNFLKEVVGSDNVEVYSTMRKALKDYLTGKTPDKDLKDYGSVEYKRTVQAFDAYRRILQRRASTHMAITGFKMAAQAMGVPKELLTEASRGMASLYQASLETTMQAATATPLETLMKSVRYTSPIREKHEGDYTYSGHEMSLIGATSETQGTDRPAFTEMWSNRGTLGARGLIKEIIYGVSQMRDFSPEALALGLANQENFEESRAAIRDEFGRTRDRRAALDKMLDKGFVSLKSLYGLQVMSTALSRSFTKAEAGVSEGDVALRTLLETSRAILWGNKLYTARELTELPEFISYRRNYELITGTGGMPGESRMPSALELEQIGTEPGTAMHAQQRQLMAMANLWGYSNAPSQPNTLLGGLREADVKRLKELGPNVLTPSEISNIYLGKYEQSTMMTNIAKMFGALSGHKELQKPEWARDEETEELFRRGNAFEIEKARKSKALSLIPRADDIKRLQFKIAGKEISGLPDFIGINQTDNGPELMLEEAKLGKSSMRGAAIQLSLYAEGMRQMARNNPEELKKVLANWRQLSSQEYEREDIGRPSINYEGFEDDVIKALNSNKVRTFITHGNYKNFEAGAKPKEYEVFTTEIGAPAEGRLEKIVSEASRKLGEEIPNTLIRLSMLFSHGKVTLEDRSTLFTKKSPMISRQLAKAAQLATEIHDTEHPITSSGLKTARIASWENVKNAGIRGIWGRFRLNPGDILKIQKEGDVVPFERAISPTGPLAQLDSSTQEQETPPEAGGTSEEPPGGGTTVEGTADAGSNRRNQGGNWGRPAKTIETRRALARQAMAAGQQMEEMYPQLMEQAKVVRQEIMARTGAELPEINEPNDIARMLHEAGKTKEGSQARRQALKLRSEFKEAKALGSLVERGIIGAGAASLGEVDFLAGEERESYGRLLKQTRRGLDTEAGPEAYSLVDIAGLTSALGGVDAAARGGAPVSRRQAELARARSEGRIPVSATADWDKSMNSLKSSMDKLKESTDTSAKAVTQNAEKTGRLEEAMGHAAKGREASERAEIARSRLVELQQARAAQGGRLTTDQEAEYKAKETEYLSMRGAAASQRSAMGRAVERAEEVGGRGGEERGLGAGLRRIFGGFGMMYLQRVLGMGMEGITEGQKEFAQYREAQQQISARMFGTTPESTAMLRRQQALIRAGGGAGAGISDLSNLFTGTIAGDVFTGAKTSFGVGLAGLFGVSELAPSFGLRAQAATGLAAPWLLGGAMLAGGLAIGARQYGYYANQQAARMSAVTGDWGRFQYQQDISKQTPAGAATYNLVTGPASLLQKAWYGTAPMIGEKVEKALAGDWAGVFTKAEATTRVEEQERAGRQFLQGTLHYQQTPAKIQDIVDYVISNQGKTEYAGLPQELVAQAITTMMAGGINNTSLALNYAKAQYAGVNAEGIYQAALTAGRQTPNQQTAAQIYSQMPTTQYAGQAMQMGLGAIQQLSAPYLQQIGGPTTALAAMNVAAQYATYQQQPWWQITQMQSQQAQQAYFTGVPIRTAAPGVLTGMTQNQIQREYYRTAFQGTIQNQAEQMAAAGYRPGTVDVISRGETGANAVYGMTGVAASNRATAIMQQMMQMGASEGAATQAYSNFLQQFNAGNFVGANVMSGMMQGNPQAAALFQMQRFGITGTQANAMGGLYQGGNRIPVDITAGGRVTGFGQFTSNITRADIMKIFGTTQGNEYMSAELGAGYKSEFGSPGAPALYGMRALQMKMQDDQFKAQTAYMQSQQAQMGLQRSYWLGGGGFGRGLWAIQDEQRGLGYRQQEWGFSQQARQMEMQREQFYGQRGLQQRQMEMTRGFTQADWAYQDITRGLNWQWRQEDFQEQARFMTGRQRRLAERGMQRETITYNLEGERIATQRDQQKQLWNLEDERFEMERTHFEENAQYTKDQLEKNKEFYEQNKKLQEEEIALTRKYQLESLGLNERSLATQLEAAKQLQEDKVKYDELNQAAQDNLDIWKTAVDYSNMIPDVFKGAYDWIKKIAEMVGVDIKEPGQTTEQKTGYHYTPTGENTTNPWQNTVITPTAADIHSGFMTINVQIGNETIAKYIIDQVADTLTVGK